VHRSDDSGTTKNFTDYLEKAAGGAWGYEADGVWPISGGESGEGTSGLIDVVSSTPGTIAYADASKAGTLGIVSIKVGDGFNAPSADGAAATLTASERKEGNGANDITYSIARDTTDTAAYPLLLLSYAIVCQSYEDPATAANVTGFLSYVASADGQASAAAAAGSAPLPADLSAEIETILAGIAGA
jgi:phosphate transport system substrate-binding protein